MASEQECDVCGRSLVVNGMTMTGIQVILPKVMLPKWPVDPAEEAEIRDYLAPYQPGAQYDVCFPCLLAALEIKPPDTGV